MLVSFALALLGSSLLGFCYAELSSMHEDSGGPYAYAKAYLGRWPSIIIGWANWGAWICASAYVGIGLGQYAQVFLPGIDHRMIASTVIALFVVVNLFGLKVSGTFQVSIMFLEVLALIWFIIIGGQNINTSSFESFAPNGWWAVIPAALIGFLALTGWDAIVVAAEEMLNPTRDIPRAIFYSLVVVFAVYAGLLIVINGVLTREQILVTESPVADVAKIILGPSGLMIITGVIVIALTATVNSFLIVISRSSYVLARDDFAPRWLGRTSRHGVPWVAVVAAGAAQIGMTWFSDLRTAVAGTGVLYTITFIGSIACLFIARKRGVHRSFSTPGYPFVPIMALALCVVFIVSAGSTGALFGGLWLAVGAVVAAITSRNSGYIKSKNEGVEPRVTVNGQK